MKRKTENLLFNVNNPRTTKDNLTLHRVFISKEFTRLDFSYIATNYYIKGGWIRIAPESYLLNSKNGKRYPLVQVDNIPLAPNRHEFESTKDWAFFSLYFKPIPKENCFIDFIEAENPTPDDFNIIGITLNMDEGIGVFSRTNFD
jgi:hypothetical protein